jgi:hypothetical protein
MEKMRWHIWNRYGVDIVPLLILAAVWLVIGIVVLVVL